MNAALKTKTAQLISATGLFALAQRLLRQRGSLVFTLHRVLPVNELDQCYNPYLAITPESLDAFVMFLKKRRPIVPLAELIENSLKGTANNLCALTFDDGWEDNFRVAFPILQAHNVSATIFLPTDLIGSTNLLPEERFCKVMISAKRDLCAELLKAKLIEAELVQEKSTLSPEQLQPFFKCLDFSGKMDLLARCEEITGTAKPHKSSFFTWDQARQMQAKGVTFGSHTMRHTILPVNTVEFVRAELAGSKERIKKEMGVTPDFFAYPNGMYNPAAVQAVREAGFRAAFTTSRAPITSVADPFMLPRIPLSNDMVNDTRERFSHAMAELLLVQTYISRGESLVY